MGCKSVSRLPFEKVEKSSLAGVTQLAECKPSKLDVVGSNPIARFYFNKDVLWLNVNVDVASLVIVSVGTS